MPQAQRPLQAQAWAAFCLFGHRVTRTTVYIDGFNLYYRALRGTPHKWLDIAAMSRAALPSHCSITAIHYYTAHVSGRTDPRAPARQHAYLRALRTQPGVTLHFGRAVERVRAQQTEDSAFPNYKYESIAVLSTDPVDRTLVDFFANHLFLGKYIRYSEDFAESNKVSQTSRRDRL